jgi:SAM-dependent methyltransferase
MSSPHALRWNPARISRFWERYESTPGMELWHFARQRGGALLRQVRKRIGICEPVLDLGCGSGYLLDILVRRKLKCFGADVNPKAIELLNNRLTGHSAFLGARAMESEQKIPFEDGSAGAVFLLETVEHLLPESIGPLFSEIRRVLKTDGVLIVTAPYRENLDGAMIVCRSCGAAFHKTQHIRSLDEISIREIVEKAGLSVLSCSGLLLLPDWNVWIKAQCSPARISITCPECGNACGSPNSCLFTRWKSLMKELRHLVCIARK